MTDTEKADRFARLHVKGAPLILYNAWDAGSAKAIADAGAPAIGTSSWAIAEAQGYRDGEAIPLAFVEQIVARIVDTCNVPVTADFEGGYSDDDRELADNLSRLLDLGVAGVNFEDRVVQGAGLYAVERQARRIAVLRATAERKGRALFINARTDLFLGQGGDPAGSVDAAIERGVAYADAGASGFFVPGLLEGAHIARICAAVPLPVNVMIGEDAPPIARLSGFGVSRVSYGPTPYIRSMRALRRAAEAALGQYVT